MAAPIEVSKDTYLAVKDDRRPEGKRKLWRVVAVEGVAVWLEDCRTFTERRLTVREVRESIRRGDFQVVSSPAQRP